MKLGTILAALTLSVGVASFAVQAQAQGGPPTPKPAAGALPTTNPNAVQKSFRTQTKDEQQSSTTTSPMEPGQSGRSRTAN